MAAVRVQGGRRALCVIAAAIAFVLLGAAFGTEQPSADGEVKASGCNHVYPPFITHGCSERFIATGDSQRSKVLRKLPKGASISSVWVSEGHEFVADRTSGCWSKGSGNGLKVALGVRCKGKPDVVARYKARKGGPTPVRLIWQVNN